MLGDLSSMGLTVFDAIAVLATSNRVIGGRHIGYLSGQQAHFGDDTMNRTRRHVTALGRGSIVGTVIAAMVLMTGCAGGPTRQCDVMVYGASAGGTIAAIAAANEGASVILVEPGRYVGGLVSGGLGATDSGNKSVIGGMSREFFIRTGQHYDEPIAWYFEPHVADQVYHGWLKEAQVSVVFGQRVDRVEKTGTHLREIRMTHGAVYRARVFMDCTYEGDLMARAGISYTVGREGMDQYGESLAGRREKCEYHQFKTAVSPYDENGKLLPCVYDGDPGEIGQADHKVQARSRPTTTPTVTNCSIATCRPHPS